MNSDIAIKVENLSKCYTSCLTFNGAYVNMTLEDLAFEIKILPLKIKDFKYLK